MPPVPASALPGLTANLRPRTKTALVASADSSFRQSIVQVLTGLRWQVLEAEGGAQAWAEAEAAQPEAVIVDSWLPDLEQSEFLKDFREKYPLADIVAAGSQPDLESARGPYRQELLYALRRCQDTDTAAWNTAPLIGENAMEHSSAKLSVEERQLMRLKAAADFSLANPSRLPSAHKKSPVTPIPIRGEAESGIAATSLSSLAVNAGLAAVKTVALTVKSGAATVALTERIPELIGNADCMLEVSRRVRLVAPRMTPVLIEGPTGSGKEIVAEAVHRLSPRNRKPFVALNCAAIPESLLEAELFGHTRGAFTGAVQGRVGRIESADGGTLFLDEIGEMPFSLQSKLLRFVECGELQRVGDNETVKVDVRIVAATHRRLAEQAHAGTFRSDLYFRLAVFLIRTPALSEHSQDLPLLVEHFMEKMGREAPLKRVDATAMAMLAAHNWPGNVRELEHVLERAEILAGDNPVITAREIDFGFSTVN